MSRVTVSTMASMGYSAMITLWSSPEKLSSLRCACAGGAGQRLVTDHVFRQRMGDRGGADGFSAALVSLAADQPLIGRNQRGVGIDPDPAVAREHLHVEVQMAGSAVGAVEIVGDHADLFALGDAAAVEQAVRIHGGRVHVHVAEADVLGSGVDL